MNDFWTTFFYIVVMVAVLIGAYLTTKFLAGKSRKLQKGKYLSLIERLPMGKDRNIVLIDVAGQNFLVGVTNQSINVLGQIDNENLNIIRESRENKTHKGFFEQFRGFITNAKDAQENLRKAREQYKGKQPSSFESNYDDLLKQMDDAVSRRRDRFGSGNGDDEK